jgi:hypothetical protein
MTQANATESMEEVISSKQISDTLSHMSIQENQQFSDNIRKGRILIASRLTYRDPNEEYKVTLSEALNILEIFEHEPDSKNVQNLAQIEIYQIDSTPLNFKRYLEFCTAINPQKERSLSANYRTNSGLSDILDKLGYPPHTDITKQLRIILSRLGNPFKNTMYVAPYDIYQFRIFYGELKNYFDFDTGNFDTFDGEDLSYRAIAENFINMSDEEIRHLCENIYLAQQQASDTILYCDIGKKQSSRWSDQERIGNIRIILNMLDDYSDDLCDVRDHHIWNSEHGEITLHRYLSFCCDLFPENNNDQCFFPFVSRGRYFGYESILNQLEPNPDFQLEEEVRSAIDNLKKTIGDPLQMSPLKLYQFRNHYSLLEEMASGVRNPTRFEQFVDFSITHRGEIIGYALFVSLIWQFYWGPGAFSYCVRSHTCV